MEKAYLLAQLGEYQDDGWGVVCGVFLSKDKGLEAFALLKSTGPRYGMADMVLYQANADQVIDLAAKKNDDCQLVVRSSWNAYDGEWVDVRV